MWAGQSAGEKGHGDKSNGWARRGGAECGGKPELASRRAAREEERMRLTPRPGGDVWCLDSFARLDLGGKGAELEPGSGGGVGKGQSRQVPSVLLSQQPASLGF